MNKQYYIYIIASKSGVLYIGVTNNITKRVYEHKNELVDGFSKKYKTKKLVYFETCSDIMSAITREKQLKSWRRDKKENLINKNNPTWKDLSIDLDIM